MKFNRFNTIGIVAFLAVILLANATFFAYADQRASNDKVPLVNPHARTFFLENDDGAKLLARALVVTVDDPDNHDITGTGEFSGVGALLLTRSDGIFLCSSTLLPSGKHVLTAAHCITDNFGNYNLRSGTAIFFDNNGVKVELALKPKGNAPHSSFTGNILVGFDVAVLELKRAAPSTIDRYDIDRDGGDDLKDEFVKVGYGQWGLGENGNEDRTLNAIVKRSATNLYDKSANYILVNFFNGVPNGNFHSNSALHFDFDKPSSLQNDAFCVWAADCQMNGVSEGNTAPGDSGGPAFTKNNDGDYIITGITSYGFTMWQEDANGVLTKNSDITPRVTDSSFGEFSGDTNVSTYAGFIDSFLTKGGGGSDDGGTPNCPPNSNKPACR